ncbi:MAG: O-antigen ligase family protein [Planctomycetota bacterium]
MSAQLNSINTETFRPNSYLHYFQQALIAILIVGAPFFLGGRHPSAHLIYAVLIAIVGSLTLLTSLLRKSAIDFRFDAIDFSLLGAISLVSFQLFELPPTVLEFFAPGGFDRLSLWGESAGTIFGAWSTISFEPQVTRQTLGLLVCWLVLYRSVRASVSSIDDLRRLLFLICLASVSMAVIGLAQYCFGNGKFLWVFEVPFRAPGPRTQGPFINSNHFAHFVALGIGPLIWLISESLAKRNWFKDGWKPFASYSYSNKPRTMHWAPLALTVIFLAGFMSLSRGGILCVLLATLVSISVALYLSKMNVKILAAVCVAAILCSGILLWGGPELLGSRLGEFSVDSSASMSESLDRTAPWSAAVNSFPEFWLFGSGAGTYAEVHKAHLTQDFNFEYTYAESGYLQILVETGLAGSFLLVVAVGTVLRWMWSTLRSNSSNLLIAIIPGIAISLLHSAVDFIWFIPACFTSTLVLIACLGSLHHGVQLQDARGNQSTERQPTEIEWSPGLLQNTIWRRCYFAFSTSFTLCLFLVIIQQFQKEASGRKLWEAYLKQPTLENTLALAEAGELQEQLSARVDLLRKCTQVSPHNSDAHLALSQTLLHLFALKQQQFGGFALNQIADASRLGDYPDASELKLWIEKAVGENHTLLYEAYTHSVHAALLCPMNAESYLYLAQLTFLTPQDKSTPDQYLQQALALRPSDGELLFASGVTYNELGNQELGYELIGRSFRLHKQLRQRILEVVAVRLSAEEFIQNFNPDLNGLYELSVFYKQNGSPSNAAYAGQAYFDVLVTQNNGDLAERMARLKEAVRLADILERADRAILYTDLALKETPNDYSLRRSMSERLLDEDRPEEAILHLKWCLARKPRDATLRRQLTAAKMATDSSQEQLRR